MDFKTTIFMYGVVNLSAGILLYILYRMFPRVTGTKFWGLAGLLNGLGGLLVVSRGAIPDFMSISVGNALIFVGYAAYVIGFYQYLENRQHYVAPVAIAIVSSVPFFWLTNPEELVSRLLVNSYALATLHLMSAYVLLKEKNRTDFTRTLLGIAFIYPALALLWRALNYSTGSFIDTDFLGTTQIANFLVFIAGATSTMIIVTGIALMISRDFQVQLAGQVASLDAKNEEKASFLAMLGHELKTPLSVIRTILVSKYQRLDLIDTAIESLDEMEGIIKSSQLAARIDSEALPVRASRFHLQVLLGDTIAGSKLRDRIRLGEMADLVICSDESLIKVIVNNLLDNASKYGDPSKPIYIDLDGSPSTGQSRITVSNHVCTNNRADEARVFERYYRGRKSHAVSGSGLGLYLVKSISELLGGQARLIPDPSRFIVQISLPTSI